MQGRRHEHNEIKLNTSNLSLRSIAHPHCNIHDVLTAPVTANSHVHGTSYAKQIRVLYKLVYILGGDPNCEPQDAAGSSRHAATSVVFDSAQ